MFKRNKIKIIEVLKNDIEECKRMWAIARDEGYSEDSYERLKYIDRIDHMVHIAASLYRSNLITHKQYCEIYKLMIDFIHWRSENDTWVDKFAREQKQKELNEWAKKMQENYDNQMRNFLGLFGFQFGGGEDE